MNYKANTWEEQKIINKIDYETIVIKKRKSSIVRTDRVTHFIMNGVDSYIGLNKICEVDLGLSEFSNSGDNCRYRHDTCNRFFGMYLSPLFCICKCVRLKMEKKFEEEIRNTYYDKKYLENNNNN